MYAFKGDLHLHSTRSTGTDTPKAMFDRLVECGFDFCALTDHDRPFECRKYENDLVVLSGQEMRAERGHVIAINTMLTREGSWSIRRQLEEVEGSGGHAILSHPNIASFSDSEISQYSSARLNGELWGTFMGIELYTHNVESGLKCAVEKLDSIWTSKVREQESEEHEDFQPVWGFAASDAHRCAEITPNVGIMVWAEESTSTDLLHAIKRGKFYSLGNTKARFDSVEIVNSTLSVSASNVVMVKIVGEAGLPRRVVTKDNPTSISCTNGISGNEGYLRIEAMDDEGHFAFSNPFYVGYAG